MTPDLQVLWDAMSITAHDRFYDAVAAINKAARRYQTVQETTGVPWQIIGALHQREASGSFKCHLHNGDPLTARTVHVPAGRPLVWNPPNDWESSAADALAYDNLSELQGWGNIATALYRIERFNGFGYRPHGINSPYLWAGTNQYTIGKYGADGHFDPSEVDQQAGCAGILKMLNYGSSPVPPQQVATTATPAADGLEIEYNFNPPTV